MGKTAYIVFDPVNVEGDLEVDKRDILQDGAKDYRNPDMKAFPERNHGSIASCF